MPLAVTIRQNSKWPGGSQQQQRKRGIFLLMPAIYLSHGYGYQAKPAYSYRMRRVCLSGGLIMLKHTDSLTIDILNRAAENALVECEHAYAVLSIWINGIPNGEEPHEGGACERIWSVTDPGNENAAYSRPNPERFRCDFANAQ